jgi:hypothetical protein
VVVCKIGPPHALDLDCEEILDGIKDHFEVSANKLGQEFQESARVLGSNSYL